LTGFPGRFVAVAIGLTVTAPERENQVTKAVFPSGVIAMAWGSLPTFDRVDRGYSYHNLVS
jgi:hypothetical protein